MYRQIYRQIGRQIKMDWFLSWQTFLQADIFMRRYMGPPGVRKSYFTYDLNPLQWQKYAFSRHVPAFDIASAGHSTVTAGCTIAYMRLIQLPGVYYNNRGSHNDVRRSHNDVCASIKVFPLNLCLIWLHIFKGCFVDLGNGYQLTIRTNQRLNWITM